MKEDWRFEQEVSSTLAVGWTSMSGMWQEVKANRAGASRTVASRAHLRSHSGCNAGAALAHAPTSKEYTIPPQLFRVLLLERLQLPLPVTEAICEGCHSALDVRGRHRAACTLSGRVKKRATPTEHVLARVCREAGARVRFDAYLRDMNVGVLASDGRRIEVLAQDLSCFGGAQFVVDITLRSALTRAGEPQRNAADKDGAVLISARRDKEAKYPELATSRRCKLVVVGIETGGRWSEEAVDFVRWLSGTGGPKFHAKIRVLVLGTPMDSDVVCRVRHRLCRLLG